MCPVRRTAHPRERALRQAMRWVEPRRDQSGWSRARRRVAPEGEEGYGRRHSPKLSRRYAALGRRLTGLAPLASQVMASDAARVAIGWSWSRRSSRMRQPGRSRARVGCLIRVGIGPAVDEHRNVSVGRCPSVGCPCLRSRTARNGRRHVARDPLRPIAEEDRLRTNATQRKRLGIGSEVHRLGGWHNARAQPHDGIVALHSSRQSAKAGPFSQDNVRYCYVLRVAAVWRDAGITLNLPASER